jgi:hypothetical protein
MYGFYPAIKNPGTGAPSLLLNGPYRNYGSTATIAALTGNYADGVSTLANGAFVVQTSSATGSTGGAGGGTYGGGGSTGGCGILTSKIKLASGVTCEVVAVSPGVYVKTPTRIGKIDRVEQMPAKIYTFVVESGLTGHASDSHMLKFGNRWMSVTALGQLLDEGEEVTVWTENGRADKLIYCQSEKDKQLVVKIHLVKSKESDEEVEHYYSLDGFWAHNIKIGPGG